MVVFLMVVWIIPNFLDYLTREGEEGQAAAHKKDIGFFKSMLCSMFAGSAASIATNPFDMGKLRL